MLAEGERRRPGEARERGGDRVGRGRPIERGQVDLVDEGRDVGVDAGRGARDLGGAHGLEPLGQLGRETRGDRLRRGGGGEIQVDVLVVAREAERDGGAEGEPRHRVVPLREGERQARAARGAQEDAADLARADEAGGAALAVAEADALRGRGRGRGRGEGRGHGAEPFFGVAFGRRARACGARGGGGPVLACQGLRERHRLG